MADILLVVATAGTPTAGDLYFKAILEGLAQTVTLRSDDDADSVSGFAGVVVAESCSSATLGTKYATAGVPVVTHEAGHVDGLGMISAEGASNEVEDQTVVLVASHPMMRGPHGSASGTITVLSSAVSFAYIDGNVVTLSADVTALAESPNTANWWTALAAEGGSFPARRAYIWPNTGASSTAVAAVGEIVLRNTYAWAFGIAPPVRSQFLDYDYSR